MTVTSEQVRRRLNAEEPDYLLLARELGPEAGEHLRALVQDEDELLASKAAYLASLSPIESGDALALAARSESPVVRLAAAAGLANSAGDDTDQVLESLLGDEDAGVRKTALRTAGQLRAVPLRAKVEEIVRSDPEAALRQQASETLSRLS